MRPLPEAAVMTLVLVVVGSYPDCSCHLAGLVGGLAGLVGGLAGLVGGHAGTGCYDHQN